MKCLIFINLFLLLSLSISAKGDNIFDLFPVKKEVKLDTLKVILTVIKYKESRGNYNAVGKKGEIGAYQFMKPTWNSLCMKYFNKILKPTRYNQDLIAKYYVQELLKKYKLIEIASIWNCGKYIPNNNDTLKYIKHFTQLFNAYFPSNKLIAYNF